jgi:hypothetical protein
MKNLQNNHGLPTGFAAQGSRTRGTGYPVPVPAGEAMAGPPVESAVTGYQVPYTRGAMRRPEKSPFRYSTRLSAVLLLLPPCPPAHRLRRGSSCGGGSAAAGANKRRRGGQLRRGISGGGGPAAAGDQPPPPSSLPPAARPVPFGTFYRRNFLKAFRYSSRLSEALCLPARRTVCSPFH